PDARSKLYAHSWPGNVRELENTVVRAALLAPGSAIRAEDIELGAGATRWRMAASTEPLNDLIERRVSEMVAESGEPRDLYQRLIAEMERPLIEIALKRAHGNQVQAARMLGLNRNTLRKKLVEHRIAVTKTPPG
ncbi:MAG TPA: helix-turn-helix domain-containing protein, partial [Candidatus Binataceae bacterium]|nr:helix-turn-helix domain-containing protein [Candidatus Binataceae bacterium]